MEHQNNRNNIAIKDAKTYEEQVEILQSRGIIVENTEFAIK